MIKETMLKSSQDEFSRNSPSFSPISDPQPPSETPIKSSSPGKIQKGADPMADLKTSKAYINAMKALQTKIKKLEGRLEEAKNDSETRVGEAATANSKLKQQLEDDRRIFASLENNLKNKLSFLEKESFEIQKALEQAEIETQEAKKQLEEETGKRDQEFKLFLKEKAEFKEKIQLQSSRIEFLESQTQALQEDLQNIRKDKLGLENKIIFVEEKCKQLEETGREQKGMFEREKERLVANIESLAKNHEGELEYLLKEKGELYDEVKKLKRENEDLCEKIQDSQRALERNSKNTQDLRENLEGYNNNRSNGKSRFKYYPSMGEEKRELFSWNTPSAKKEPDNRTMTFVEHQRPIIEKNVGVFLERNQSLKSLQRSPIVKKDITMDIGHERNIDKSNLYAERKEMPIERNNEKNTMYDERKEMHIERKEIAGERNNEKNTIYAEKPPVYDNKHVYSGGSYVRSLGTEKNEEFDGKNLKKYEQSLKNSGFVRENEKNNKEMEKNNKEIVEKNTVIDKNFNSFGERNVERKLIFKNNGDNNKKMEKSDDFKENLRQILKNESFSGNKFTKIEQKQDDSDYEKNISDIIDLEKDLLELNKVYHDLTEQILVIF